MSAHLDVMPMNKMKLRRYTDIPILLDMLVNRKITLLDPASWEDRNDSFYVEKYRSKNGASELNRLDFTKNGRKYWTQHN